MCDPTILAIFTPGNSRGFLYTKGLHSQAKHELFALDVPYSMLRLVGSTMRFLSNRLVLPHQTVRGATKFHLRPVGKKRRKELMRTHLLQMDPDARILELSPASGWPAPDGPAPVRRCKSCQCALGDAGR